MEIREQALEWWNKQTIIEKSLLAIKYSDYLQGRGSGSLTGREIEEIWRKETQEISINKSIEDNLKSAQELSKQPQVNWEMLKDTINNIDNIEYIKGNYIQNLQLFFYLLSTKPTFVKAAHENLK